MSFKIRIMLPDLSDLPGSLADRPAAAAVHIVYIWHFADKITPFRARDWNARVSCRLRYQLKKTVVLVGMMGAGKTAVGTALARLVGAPFLDSDAEIEKAANMTIAEIFDA